MAKFNFFFYKTQTDKQEVSIKKLPSDYVDIMELLLHRVVEHLLSGVSVEERSRSVWFTCVWDESSMEEIAESLAASSNVVLVAVTGAILTGATTQYIT